MKTNYDILDYEQVRQHLEIRMRDRDSRAKCVPAVPWTYPTGSSWKRMKSGLAHW